MSDIKYEDFLYTYHYNGKEFIGFNENEALAYLLKEDVCFINTRPYVENPWQDKDSWTIGGETIVVFALCNDVFAWGSADAETVQSVETIYDEDTYDYKGDKLYLHTLLKAYLEEGYQGVVKWCCIKRNERPQEPVEQKLRESGCWDDIMELLPENSHVKFMREKYS